MPQNLLNVTGVVVDDTLEISLRDLCRLCGVSAELVIDMIEEGVIEPLGSHPREWRFGGKAITRMQVALRLQRDLRVNLPGAALVLELLEEIEELRRLHRWRRL